VIEALLAEDAEAEFGHEAGKKHGADQDEQHRQQLPAHST
jgi:hypothetical protein